MHHPTLMFRCESRSEANLYHTIRIQNHIPLCTCLGTHWCSHIDATLYRGERHMVPFEEWDIADQAQQLLAGRLRPPPHWRAHWQGDKVWRGLAKPRPNASRITARSGKPTICFVGRGKRGSRAHYAEQATKLGWAVVPSPSPWTTLVVCATAAKSTRNAQVAMDLRLPMLPFTDWDEAAADLSEMINAAIRAQHSGAPPAQTAPVLSILDGDH